MNRWGSLRLAAGILAAIAVLATAGVGTAAAKGFGQPPRGSDQGHLFNCYAPSATLFVGDDCVAAAFNVPPGGQPLNDGQFEITVPPGTTVTPTIVYSGNIGGTSCIWNGGYSVSGQTITVSTLTCPQGSTFLVSFGADVESAVGSYTLSGDYKVNDLKRTSTNVFRYAQDPVVDVAQFIICSGVRHVIC